LMALNVAIQLASGLDARSRDLIRNSANRIRDIANNLVQKSKTGSFEIVNSVVTVEMIGAIVEDLASEKRLEFRKLPELVLDTDISNSYGLFAKIAANDLKRVLSNLINNSNEALKSKGRISITVRRSEFLPSRLCIDIVDNGPGFSDQILDLVGHQQISAGKKDHEHSGLGLGTFHAMQTVKSWGGEISFQNIYNTSQGVQSVPDVLGARVLIELPMVEAPQWFCPEIKVYNQSQIMIFDDDHTVQMMWKEKIRKLKFDGMTAPLHCVAFGYGRQLMENTFGNLSDIDTVFVDYEIAGDQKNGLDYIRELEIGKNSVLITSHYEDSKIQQSALELGIKIIPKTMAHLVPFQFSQSLPPLNSDQAKEERIIEPENLFDGVLIDDSSEIHLVWNVHRNGKKIKIYPYPKTFIEDCHSLDPRSPVFLDLHFGKHGEGLDFVKEIYSLGFKDITIVTSYAKAHVVIPPELRHMIKEVRGKIPPWAKSTGLEEYEF
ncbi:MAG TPA: HAMP domain-containing sensor histidine kinase, partial [Pseudobdellovibrionaceae bacterium]|nr:HAMP domain-containing sensor histidine kinase [Pseudobdellovibrionaceae bacterium]